MSERPKDVVDPDATVMLPSDRSRPEPDPDSTVMMPAERVDDDATVMMPSRRDDDATVMMPVGGLPAEPDPDATVMFDQRTEDESGGPLVDPDATIAIPTPGKRRISPAAGLPAAPSGEREPVVPEFHSLGGLNPLVAAANPVLAVVPQIRHTLRHPDPEGLRAALRMSLDAFESAARSAGYSNEAVADASYALCVLLDESAASTPWGASWEDHGITAERHAEAGNGEKVSRLVEKFVADPAANLVPLEFLYACLALGLEARFGRNESGREKALGLRAQLLAAIRAQHPPHDGELSGSWRGVAAPVRRTSGGLAIWAVASGAALFLSILYAGFSISLGSLSDPVTRDMAQLRMPPFPTVSSAGLVAAANPRISEQLAAEIARGEVAVTDAAGSSTIVIRGDRLFASGSARLENGVEPVILRVADALDRVPGTILVTGHTDDVPIRTARFPSNWELSTERASSVMKIVAGRLKDPARLRTEGLADSEPIVPNDSATNRARNRRVTITLRSAP